MQNVNCVVELNVTRINGCSSSNGNFYFSVDLLCRYDWAWFLAFQRQSQAINPVWVTFWLFQIKITRWFDRWLRCHLVKVIIHPKTDAVAKSWIQRCHQPDTDEPLRMVPSPILSAIIPKCLLNCLLWWPERKQLCIVDRPPDNHHSTCARATNLSVRQHSRLSIFESWTFSCETIFHFQKWSNNFYEIIKMT